MKRRTRKQWYEYHLGQSQKAAQDAVRSQYKSEVDRIEAIQTRLKAALADAKNEEPRSSKLLAIVGKESSYRSDVLSPLRKDLEIADHALRDVIARRQKRLDQAAEQGAKDYVDAHAQRKVEAEERAERVTERKYEQRLRYLEKSPALRSAAKALKEHLIFEQFGRGGGAVCYYCGKSMDASKSHLEHKRPLSRGGNNRRSNLAISCASCNLRKGTKTDKEFFRHLSQ